MTDTFDSINKAMAEALYLEPDDIAANRSGTITERQKDRIHGQLRAAYIGMGCVGIISIVPALAILYILNTVAFQIIVLIGTVVWAILAVRTVRDVNKRRSVIEHDLDNNAVAAAEGELKRKTEKRTQFVGVNEMWFVIPKSLYDALPEGAMATIYYLSESKQFLALESTG